MTQACTAQVSTTPAGACGWWSTATACQWATPGRTTSPLAPDQARPNALAPVHPLKGKTNRLPLRCCLHAVPRQDGTHAIQRDRLRRPAVAVHGGGHEQRVVNRLLHRL